MLSHLPRLLAFVLVMSILMIVAEATWMPWAMIDSKIDQVRLGDFQAFQSGLEDYRRAHGVYPESLQPLGADHLVSDPWGSQYIYERPSPNHYLLRSAGANGVDEHGEGDDVTTWPKHYDCATYGVDCPPDFKKVARLVPCVTALGSAAMLALLACWATRRRFVRWLDGLV